MNTKLTALILATSFLFVCLVPAACRSSATPITSPILTAPSPTGTMTFTTGPGAGAIVQSDSIVTAKIVAIRAQTTGYPWEMDVLIQNSVDVDNLPNPVKDKTGQVVTVRTDEKMDSFKVDDVINARIKFVGDVPRPGIILYIYSVQLQQHL